MSVDPSPRPLPSSLAPTPGEPVAAYVRRDPGLWEYWPTIERRLRRANALTDRLTGGAAPAEGACWTPPRSGLWDAAQGHRYFGLHRAPSGCWRFREWAPNATAVYFCGPATQWRPHPSGRLTRIAERGVWEIELPANALRHGDHYHLRIQWPGGSGKRIPAYATWVTQFPDTAEFDAVVWDPPAPYPWRHAPLTERPHPPLVYEAHVGMATAEERVGTFAEFQRDVLPRIVHGGYNTVQLMAVAEHPYYGSFGYHVSSFFAPSSRFGTPDDLRALVDTAHGMGLAVIFDLVHSHAARNEIEGLSRFDGTDYQYFHTGARGYHEAWDTRCFDYGKDEVVHFLLSNLRYWLEEFRCDGFRFDGVTSMLYRHHGLGRDFLSYESYYDDSFDEDGAVYLTLANRMIHEGRPHALTVAEDMSGLPGLAVSTAEGGVGFDYRLGMGLPDHWVKLVRETKDEDWPVGDLFYRVGNRRRDEPTIAYVESHDQAMVGDQTLIFRLIGPDMYRWMNVFEEHWPVTRGLALCKLVRLLTLAVGGEGYLNFMGNEFGHPEWIDFPRLGNRWSHRYARRQWHLRDDTNLRYRFLGEFDRALLGLAVSTRLLEAPAATLLRDYGHEQILVFSRAGLVFVMNFSPALSSRTTPVEIPPGTYQVLLDTTRPEYGGMASSNTPTATFRPTSAIRREHVYWELPFELPCRSAVVLGRPGTGPTPILPTPVDP
ncbi:MAG: alpha-amylase family glycosyl hydrolase [Planctomycetota bacterium]